VEIEVEEFDVVREKIRFLVGAGGRKLFDLEDVSKKKDCSSFADLFWVD
jgi:hypothetical protein